MNIPDLARSAQASLSKNSPAILTGLAVGGVIATAVMASKATVLAVDEVRYLEKDYEEPMDARGWVQTTWKLYIPAAVMGTATVACIIGAHTVNTRRTAALAGAYSLADKALTEYQEKVREQFGVAKEEKVREAIVEDHLKANPMDDKQIIVTPLGDTLCYDAMSGRYFKSDIEIIRRAVNDLNQQLLTDMWVSLNEFYDLLDLSHTKLGDEMGWEPDNLLEVVFTTKLAENGQPVLVLDYRTRPRTYR